MEILKVRALRVYEIQASEKSFVSKADIAGKIKTTYCDN